MGIVCAGDVGLESLMASGVCVPSSSEMSLEASGHLTLVDSDWEGGCVAIGDLLLVRGKGSRWDCVCVTEVSDLCSRYDFANNPFFFLEFIWPALGVVGGVIEIAF